MGGGTTVRADLLTELLTGRRQSEKGAVRAVKLAGARITGRHGSRRGQPLHAPGSSPALWILTTAVVAGLTNALKRD